MASVREIELEKGESNAIPFLLITVLVFAILSAAVYFLLETRRAPTVEQATQLVTRALDAQGPTTVRFHTGLLKERPDESPRDARYRLLAEAGVLEIDAPVGSRTRVTLTDRGSEILSAITGVKRSHQPDDTEAYVVPLAVRKLVDIVAIKMDGPESATIEYTWEWEPNSLGEIFDRLGPALTFMSAQDQLDLVNHFEVRYYHAVPQREVLRATKSTEGWQWTPQ